MSQSMEMEELQKLADNQSEMAIVLTVGWIIFLSCYIPVHFLLKGHDRLRKKLERVLVELICSLFVASWTGVVKYHGPRPSIRPKQVFVANHMSMIDFIILEQMTAFAVIMQKHPGNVTLKHAISHHLPVRYHGALPTLEKEGAVKDFSSACCQMAMHAWRDFAELNANLA